jgi:hypothetical protein
VSCVIGSNDLTFLPQREIERLNYKYWILKVLFKNKDYFAPLDSPKLCLDIGCGSGIWTSEFGTFICHRMTPPNIPQPSNFLELL